MGREYRNRTPTIPLPASLNNFSDYQKSRCPTLFPKLDISSSVSSVLYTDVGGPDVGGPDVLLCFQNCTSRLPFLQCCYIILHPFGIYYLIKDLVFSPQIRRTSDQLRVSHFHFPFRHYYSSYERNMLFTLIVPFHSLIITVSRESDHY